MAVYLVTGGAGFIGSHLVDALVKQGEKVRVLDDFSTGTEENLHSCLSKIELVRGDIRNTQLVPKVMQGVGFVLHQAALRAVQRSVDDPWETNDVNVSGTLNLLLAAREAGVKRFVYASSSSVYGDSPERVKKEEDKPRPISPYAASKIMGEYYCSIFHRLYHLETVSLRYFNVFGPRQSPFSQYAAVIPIFMQKLTDGEPAEIHGDGLQTRDFSYIDNVVSSNLLAVKAAGVGGEVFNVGCGETHSVQELYDELKKLLAVKAQPVYTPARPGDVRTTLADISKIRNRLGYKVLVNFKDGLRRTLDWYLATRKQKV